MREYVSDYIGLPLLTRGGERLGYVKNVQTDKNLTRVRNLECCDEDEEEFILPLSAAASFGEGAIVVKSPAAKGCKNCLPAPLGKEAFSTEGAPLGRVRDFGREGALIKTLVLSDGREIAAERAAGVTDTVLIDLSENFVPGPVARAKRKSEPKEGTLPAAGEAALSAAEAADGADGGSEAAETAGPAEDEGAEVLTVYATANAADDADAGEAEPTGEGAAPAPESDTAAEPWERRTRKAAGRGLLTGKILPQDLPDARGNVLARAGTVVNADVIRTAMRHDKLFELTLLCCSAAPFGLWR